MCGMVVEPVVEKVNEAPYFPNKVNVNIPRVKASCYL